MTIIDSNSQHCLTFVLFTGAIATSIVKLTLRVPLTNGSVFGRRLAEGELRAGDAGFYAPARERFTSRSSGPLASPVTISQGHKPQSQSHTKKFRGIPSINTLVFLMSHYPPPEHAKLQIATAQHGYINQLSLPTQRRLPCLLHGCPRGQGHPVSHRRS